MIRDDCQSSGETVLDLLDRIERAVDGLDGPDRAVRLSVLHLTRKAKRKLVCAVAKIGTVKGEG